MHVIWAEFLDRNVDIYAVAACLRTRYSAIQCGAQGDDWLWLDLPEGRMEIDTFYSHELLVHGPSSLHEQAGPVLALLANEFDLITHDPPKAAMWM